MEIKSLENIELARIVECFNLAFADYFVPMPTEIEFWSRVWKATGVNYNLSFGIFDKNKLVGFIIHGVGSIEDKMVAFNSGTGVLPDYRGRHFTYQLYKHAIPVLKDHGITHCRLEVIRENERAIRVYEKIGFKVIQNYKCFRGNIETPDVSHLEIVKFELDELNGDQMPDFRLVSWDNRKEAILSDSEINQTFCVFEVDEWLGTFIIQPRNGYLADFKVREDSVENGEKLFSAMKGMCPHVRINNIDDSLDEKIQLLLNVGLENHIDQFLMEMKL